jgi:hypothetical protein
VSGTVTQLEPWMTLAELADHLGCGKRWLEYRTREGMPSALIAGRRKYKASEVEKWLSKEGHLTRSVA